MSYKTFSHTSGNDSGVKKTMSDLPEPKEIVTTQKRKYTRKKEIFKLKQKQVFEIDGRKLKYDRTVNGKSGAIRYQILEYLSVFNRLTNTMEHAYFPIHNFYDRPSCKQFFKNMITGANKLINILE